MRWMCLTFLNLLVQLPKSEAVKVRPQTSCRLKPGPVVLPTTTRILSKILVQNEIMQTCIGNIGQPKRSEVLPADLVNMPQASNHPILRTYWMSSQFFWDGMNTSLPLPMFLPFHLLRNHWHHFAAHLSRRASCSTGRLPPATGPGRFSTPHGFGQFHLRRRWIKRVSVSESVESGG